MKNLKFAPRSWRVGRYKEILRPGKNDLDRNFLCNHVRDWDVLSGMPIIGDVRLQGQTLAEVFGRRLQETEILPAATQSSQGYEDRHAGQVNQFEPFEFVTHRSPLDAIFSYRAANICRRPQHTPQA